MKRSLLPLSLLLLAGCGGGRGSSLAAVEQAPLVAITADNAMEVARSAVRAAFDLQRVLHLVLAALVGETAAPPPAGAGSWSVAGPSDGEVIVSWQDRDASGNYSSGDAITLTFVAYADQEIELAGAVVAPTIEVRGNPFGGSTWSLAATMELRGLRVTTAAGSEVVDAAVRVVRERREIVESIELVLLERGGAPIAYACCGKGADLQGHWHELGGRDADLAVLLPAAMHLTEQRDAAVLVPPYRAALRDMLGAQVVDASTVPGPMVCAPRGNAVPCWIDGLDSV